MTDALASELFVQGLWTVLVVLLPVLVTAFVVTLISSALQSATTVQDGTLSSLPRLVAVLVALVVFGPWMMRSLVTFTRTILADFSRYVA